MESQRLVGLDEEDEAVDSTLTVFVATWNMHGKYHQTTNFQSHPPNNDLTFIPARKYDIYAIGVQECERSIETSVVFPSGKKNWEAKLAETITNDYVMVRSENLGALHLAIFVSERISGEISEIQSQTVSAGIGNVLNNKGAIGISLCIGKTSFLFINSHFDSGQSRSEERKEAYERISTQIFKDLGTSPAHPLHTIFDRVFWFGDFNYRIEAPADLVENCLKSNNLEVLARKDQFVQAKSSGVFRGYAEGPLRFKPTYKFEHGTLNYDYSGGRIPSWTDRILYKVDPHVTLKKYTSCPEVLWSDHIPVVGVFQVKYRKGSSEYITSRPKKKESTCCDCCNCCSIV